MKAPKHRIKSNKFRVALQGKQTQQTNIVPMDAFSVRPVTHLGPIPEVPKELVLLLLAFNEICTESNMKKPPSRTTVRNVKNLNGFMAFRAFYCRSVSQFQHQRELSRRLGEIWKEYPHKAYWRAAAERFKSFPSEFSFVDWLCLQLQLSQNTDKSVTKVRRTKLVKNMAWSTIVPEMSKNVEDVFLI